MFQTNVHIWLQQFDNEWILQFFKAITALGYMEFFIVSMIIITFGIHFRKGFVLLLIVMWTAGVTLVLKDTFDLPRPYMVENDVQLWDGEVGTNIALLDDADAEYFFQLLPKNTMDYFDNQPISYGFPSGHTSIAVVFWGSLMLLFRKRWLMILCWSLIVLIPFSRIYLGVHFIADVLGGYLVGSLMLWAFYKVVIAPEALEKYLNVNKHPFRFDMKNILIFFAPFVWLLLITEVKYWIVPGVLLGFGLGFMLLSQKGLPDETGTVLNRIFRAFTALIIFVGFDFIIKTIIEFSNLEYSIITGFFRYVLGSLFLIWVGSLINIKLGWTKRSIIKEI